MQSDLLVLQYLNSIKPPNSIVVFFYNIIEKFDGRHKAYFSFKSINSFSKLFEKLSMEHYSNYYYRPKEN